VRVDCTQLERCLLNLVINARDAMRGRGHVTIEVEAVDLAESRGHRHGEIPAGRWTVVRVVDDGPGMEAATLDRVFEPFFSTKPTGEGTGLGLPTVLGIASQLGGHVVIESAPAKGTRVSLFFPRIEPC
jgi:two-component system cell cycle sensor histidine kinase/response regulator CckA